MNNKKYLVAIIFLILSLLISFVIIYFDGKKNPGNQSKKFSYTIESEDFFTVRNAINEYLEISNDIDLEEVVNKHYLTTNNINISTMLSDYYEPSFVATKMYTKKVSDKVYYYVNGYIIDRQYGSDYDYYSNVNYLVIVFNDKYVINPLPNNIDYYKNITEEDYSIDNGKSLTIINVTDYNKITSYISNFYNLLYADTNRAYNMLTSNSKTKYGSLNGFSSEKNNIFNKVNASVTNFDKTENEDNITYDIYLDNGNKVKVIEKDIMNYEIEI